MARVRTGKQGRADRLCPSATPGLTGFPPGQDLASPSRGEQFRSRPFIEDELVYNWIVFMLPDFPKVKEILIAHATAYIEQLVRQEPILRGVRQVHHFEGSEIHTRPSSGPMQSSG